MGFKNLTNIHSFWYAQRVKYDIDGLAIFVIGHVFHGFDHRDHTLVSVPPGHFVARLNAAFDGEINLNNLQNARGQVVPAFKLVFTFGKLLVQIFAAFLQALVSLL